MKLVIFTDLDGTLLDYTTYSFEPASEALHSLEEKRVPLVICSSKTKAEIIYFRKKLNNCHPFVSENGGGIFIPQGYFDETVFNRTVDYRLESNYWVIRLGANYRDLRRAVSDLQGEGFDVRGFGDMDIEEVANLTNLSYDLARRAKVRDFDEPFIFKGNEEKRSSLFSSIKTKGFNFTEGNYFHLMGNSDKGKAASLLIELYEKQYSGLKTVAIGDGPNDIPMLECVDFAVVVQGPEGRYDSRVKLPALIKAEGVGPWGWNKAVLKLLETLLSQKA